MECPSCGEELIDAGNKRVKWRTFSGVSKSSLGIRSRRLRIWKCKDCDKIFALRMQLVEAEPAN